VLAFVQISVWAILSWVLATLMPAEVLADGSRLGGLHGTLTLLGQSRAWLSILFLGVLATALAFYLMSTLQAYLGATEAAILYSLEPLFAALLAVSALVPGIREHITLSQMLGGIVILVAMLLAELGPRLLGSPRLQSGDVIG
jgi:drug/metabolite transporter (DMT)-like permease